MLQGKMFNAVPFYDLEIIRVSFRLRRMLLDYMDYIILVTATRKGCSLFTEDDIYSNK